MKKQYSEPAMRLIGLETDGGVICASAQDLLIDNNLLQYTEEEFWI